MSLKAVYTDTDDLDPTPGIEKLRAAGFDVVRLETHNGAEILEAARDADALLLGYAPITAEMLAQMPKLQIVSLLSTGYDNIDVPAATERGICVANIGATSAQEVATHAFALILSMVRGIGTYKAVADRREWFKTPYPHIPPRLSQKKLGLVGFGNIGRSLATYALPIFESISFYDPAYAIGEVVNGAVSTSLDEVLASSDVLSLHMPLMPATKHIFNDTTFAKMKRGVYIVNVSRGGLIDSAALIRALDSGIVKEAALDVLESEPPAEGDALLKHPHVLITPHVAFLSEYSMSAYIDVQSENIVKWFSNQEVINSVNGMRNKK